ncbi:tetratricopeptide repeat protein (macronuclear) [Tetrahymena thermophila SB210]|uniref:Tetratricopeptide repeat protein n=1 Tax=Tetrahymena thermophila (strain SB210) TaxID=312017 RepID=I7ML48_TETTS|nr:tetratricopeptide repeat protein [Tetrahymena thermophila SB210]EAS01164.2 tetratricopeptide repeat protein [Tetrahymena thermophila SB210]|eukprot:XP_001021409.2 tetratricopeptide repeat protein [Tetrahymena thermophila SB210]
MNKLFFQQDQTEEFKTIYEIKFKQQNWPDVEKSFIISSERLKYIEESILWKNQQAMKNLNKGNKQDAITLLKEAERQLFDEYIKDKYNIRINRLIGITLNNLGCYFQKDEKPQVALKYLQKALEIETISQNDFSTLSGTHLNICAILSSLGKHQDAIKHAKAALYFVQKAKQEILQDQETQENFNSQNESTILLQKLKTQIVDLAVSLQKSSYNIYTTEIISYYNLGIEYQHLRDYKKSLHMLKAGYNIAYNQFGIQNPLCIKMEEAVRMVEQLLSKVMAKVHKKMYRNSFIGLIASNQPDLKSSNNSFINIKADILDNSNQNNNNDAIYMNSNFKSIDNIQLSENNNIPSSRQRSHSNNLTYRSRPKFNLKLPNLNSSTIEDQSRNESPYFNQTKKPLIQKQENIQPSPYDKKVYSKQDLETGIKQANQKTINTNKNTLDTKNDHQETIFAQFIRKKQQIGTPTQNESSNYLRASSFENINSEKSQQFISLILNNMETRNNQNLNEQTQEDWQENLKRLQFLKVDSSTQTNQFNKLNNKYQRSLSTNPRSKQQNINQTSTLEPLNINYNKEITYNQNQYSKTPNNQHKNQQNMLKQLEELYEKKNIQHIRTKLNSYSTNSQIQNPNLENFTIQSPKGIKTKPVTSKRIRFQKIMPSNNISRRIKTDYQDDNCIQEENDYISEYKSIKK